MSVLSFCDFFWPGIKSEVSQSQSKLHPRPPQAPWTEFHPASLTSTSRCGKQKICHDV